MILLSCIHFLSFITCLSISIFLSHSILPPPRQINFLLSFPSLCFFLCSVSFLAARLRVAAAAALRPCQDQVALKSWQRQRLPGFAGRYPARGCDVLILTSTVKGWKGRWKEGCWEQAGRTHKKIHNDTTRISLHLITTLVCSKGASNWGRREEEEEKDAIWCGNRNTETEEERQKGRRTESFAHEY